MDYTPNIDAQGMRRPMGPVDQPNWNGGPKLIHNPQVMNNQTVGQPAINKLELTASQCAQNQYLVNQLRPAAVPAFTVPNPYANYGFGCYCGSTNNGCC